jgi:UPF0755 protein
MAFIKKLFTTLIFFALVIALGGGYYFYQWTEQPIALSQPKIELTIKPGSSIRSAARQVAQVGVDMNPWLFEALVRTTPKIGHIKAGTYEVKTQETPNDILKKLLDGKVVLANLSIIEGWTFKQMRNVIDAHPALKHDTTGLSDTALLEKIGSQFTFAEGLFFPDTYLFTKGSSDIVVYKNAHKALLEHLDAAWQARDQDLPYKDSYQALTMASIIEKETGQASERGMIASVFVNRLKVGMMLQTDPTVIYGMGDRFKGNIRKTDLQTDTPYNTYTRAGLPPTPIALPGKDSLKAAMHPEPSNAFYFVARGNGTSHFSNSLDEHNRAVNKFQR